MHATLLSQSSKSLLLPIYWYRPYLVHTHYILYWCHIVWTVGINGGAGGETARHNINDGFTQSSQWYITMMHILIDCMLHL